MSEPISPDTPAGRTVPEAVTHAPIARSGGVAARITHRWWLVVASVVVAAIVALGILVTTKATYTAKCILLLEPAGGSSKDIPPDEFLGAQRALVLSPRVMTVAQETGATPQLRESVDVRLSVGEGLLTINVSAFDAQVAARGANALCDAYLKARAEQQGTANSGLTELTAQRDSKAAARASAEKALKDFRDASNVTGSDAERGVISRLEQLTGALTTAQLELANATASAQAGQAMLADPAKINQVVEANRSKGIFAGLDQQKSQLENELQQSQTLLERQKQTMSPQHPKVMETQRKIESLDTRLSAMQKQYGEVYAAWLDQQKLTARRKVDELTNLVHEQSTLSKDFVAKSARLKELDASLKSAQDALDEIDKRIRDAKLTGEASGPTMRIVQPASPPLRPSSPDRIKVMTTALLVGLLVGLALAAIGKSTR